MYLEISPRRTGKTTRLIEFANDIDQSNPEVSCIIVVMNFHLKKRVDVMPEKNKTVLVISQNEVEKTLLGYRGRAVTPILFYDEFDFINPRNIIPCKDFYYSTTPKRTRDYIDIIEWRHGLRHDPLLSLLEMNDWQYTAQSSIGWLARDVDRLLYTIKANSTEGIHTEYEGNFLDLSVKHVSN